MKPSAESLDPTRCPLCGRSNQCQLCTSAPGKPCWCAAVEIPAALLAGVPAELRNRACLCESCVQQFQRETNNQPMLPGDSYFNAQGLVVFTEEFLRHRGACCGSGCRHCPYPE